MKMDINGKKKTAAGLSIISNVFITALKIFAGVMSGSISIISEAVHSLSDFFASALTFFSVIKSSEPADDDHQYGHGRYEDMAGFAEGILIILAAIYIICESVKKIVSHTPFENESNFGIIVMLTAVILNIAVSGYLFKIAKESGSISLYADGEHLRTDVYSSLGVLAGLVLIKITGYSILDPIIAIFIAIFIFNAGYMISKKALKRLLDYSLPKEDITKIENIVNEYSENVKLKKHGIKTRQTGPYIEIELVLQFPKETSLCKCHQICEEIEKNIGSVYKNASVSIHSEPACYKKNCENLCCNKN